MNSRILLLIALSWAIVMTACDVAKQDSRADLIRQDSLIGILTDLYLADAAHANGGISDAVDINNVAAVRAGVLKKQQVSAERFKATMRYYADHPDELVAVYDKVIEELSRRQSRAPRQADLPVKKGAQ